MSFPRFLCDEHVAEALIFCLVQYQEGIKITRVGKKGAPPKGTTDPDLLFFAEKEGYALITFDKRTLPRQVAEHLAVGGHTWGIFLLRPGFSLRRYAEDLYLIWSASQGEEWRDGIEYLPF